MKRILAVDDDPDILTLLRSVLARADRVLDCAGSAEEALERLSASTYDLALTDVVMPGIDGLELLRRMRRMRPEMNVVVMTAHATPQGLLESLRGEAFTFFSKPFAPAAVAEMVESALAAPAAADDIRVCSAVPHFVGLRVRCRLETVDRLTRFLRELALDLEEEARDNLATAFRELLMNAIEHGGKADPDKWVRVTHVRTARSLLYYIEDPGPGFSFAAIPHAAVSHPGDPMKHLAVREEQGLRSGGFGLLLTRNIADEVIYSERGNEVMLVKHL